jgi:hypothetical protein
LLIQLIPSLLLDSGLGGALLVAKGESGTLGGLLEGWLGVTAGVGAVTVFLGNGALGVFSIGAETTGWEVVGVGVVRIFLGTGLGGVV